MSIRERAAAALVRAREAAIAVPANDPPHRLRVARMVSRSVEQGRGAGTLRRPARSRRPLPGRSWRVRRSALASW